jgi:hypothetical protein
MDSEALKAAFGDLSPEDLELLRKELGMEEEKPKEEPPPAPPTASEIASAVASKIPTPPPPPEAPPAPREAFDMKRFQEEFLRDPAAGIDYMYTAKMGFSPTQVLPVMAAALAQTRQDLEQLRSQSFRSQHQLADEEYQKVEQFRQSKNLDWQDAYDLAKVRGLVGQQTTQTPSAPPRLPRGGGKVEQTMDEATILQHALGMDETKLEDMLIRAGVISQRHL